MTVKSADKKPEKYMGSDGKPKIRMVPVDKNVTNEVSKGMVGRYLKKATPSAADGGRDSVMGSGKEKQGVKKVINRITGTRTAVDKMTGKAKVPATEEAEKHVFRFSTKTKQGNIHHSSKDHKSAADAIQKRTGEKVQSMTYKGTVSAMPRRRAVKEDPAFYKAIAKQQAADQAKRDAQDPAAAARRKTAKANIAKRKPVTPDSVGRHSSQGSGFIGRRNEDSDAVKAFLAKGGKIKKLPPAKAQGYHGKDDPGKDMHGVMDKPDTKAMGTRKKVKSMEGKRFADLRAQIAEGYASYAQQKAAHASMAERGKKKSKNESMLGHRDAEKLNGGKSKDSNFKSPESHIDHHHRKTGGHEKSGGDADRHRYQVAKKLGYDV